MASWRFLFGVLCKPAHNPCIQQHAFTLVVRGQCCKYWALCAQASLRHSVSPAAHLHFPCFPTWTKWPCSASRHRQAPDACAATDEPKAPQRNPERLHKAGPIKFVTMNYLRLNVTICTLLFPVYTLPAASSPQKQLPLLGLAGGSGAWCVRHVVGVHSMEDINSDSISPRVTQWHDPLHAIAASNMHLAGLQAAWQQAHSGDARHHHYTTCKYITGAGGGSATVVLLY